MTQIDVNSLLSQMRSLSAQLESPSLKSPVPGNEVAPDSFGNLLKKSLSEVSSVQTQAQELSAGFERGDPGLDLPQVMLATQKADLAFRAMTEVRNKLVDAYRDVMNMPM